MNSDVMKALDDANGAPRASMTDLSVLNLLVKGHALALEALREIIGHIRLQLTGLHQADETTANRLHCQDQQIAALHSTVMRLSERVRMLEGDNP